MGKGAARMGLGKGRCTVNVVYDLHQDSGL